ncbi:MAG TPA: superinfection immunity protein [Rickettsiales bacterium]|nr:superinfection immunity protein [Rickettsiales bacterium]
MTTYEQIDKFIFSINPFALIAIGVVLFFLHFLPSILAVTYRKGDQVRIFMLNVIFGWTIIGWVFLLVWSLTKTRTLPADPLEREK